MVMTMTSKTTKTILLASLIAAVVLPFSGMMMVEAAQDKTTDVKEPEPPTLAEMQKNTEKVPREKVADLYMDSLSFPPPMDLSKGNTAGSGNAESSSITRVGYNPNPSITLVGTGHEAFGTLLDVDTTSQTGIYSKNEVHDGAITLKDDTYLYAPVTYPANESPVEVVTFYVDEGMGTGMKEHVVLYNHVTEDYDWSNDFEIDSNFMNDYTIEVSGSDYYYTYVYKSGSDWYVYIYDVTNAEWDLWDTISGSSSTTGGVAG